MLNYPDRGILATLHYRGAQSTDALRERIGEGFEVALSELESAGKVRLDGDRWHYVSGLWK